MQIVRTAALILAVTATGALAACGGGSDSSTPSTADAGAAVGDTTTSTTGPADDGPGDDHDPPRVTVGASDYAFDDVPATVPVGTRLDLDNTSSVEAHEMVALRLPDSETRSADELSLLSADELARVKAIVPTAVIVAAPGATGEVVLGDGVLSEPGRYLLACAIPIGADPEEFMSAARTNAGPPQVDGGPPHFTAGMVAELTVA